MASFNRIIYLTTNLLNGKIYIGQSVKNDPYYLGGGKNLKRSIKKYGRSNFVKIILMDNIKSEIELNYWEIYYIDKFNSTNKEIGYNISLGGREQGNKHNQESIEKIRTRSLQKDNMERIVKIQKLASEKRIGTHHSETSKLKMNNTRFGINRIIEIYDIHENYITKCNFISEAVLFTGSSKSSIKNNLCGLSKSTNNYNLKYKEII